MQSIFDTRRAVFQPEHVSILVTALQVAIDQVGPDIHSNTERQLGKVVVNLARRKVDAGHEIDANALATEAVGFISQLRSSQWLS